MDPIKQALWPRIAAMPSSRRSRIATNHAAEMHEYFQIQERSSESASNRYSHWTLRRLQQLLAFRQLFSSGVWCGRATFLALDIRSYYSWCVPEALLHTYDTYRACPRSLFPCMHPAALYAYHIGLPNHPQLSSFSLSIRGSDSKYAPLLNARYHMD